MKIFIRVNNLIISVLLIVFLSSCGGGKSDSNTDTDGKGKTQIEEKPGIELNGFYVTSQHENISKYSADFLFDGTNKPWATMVGAGPDEGVMLYFPKGTKLGELEIEFPSDGEFEKISTLGLYVNGQYIFDYTAEKNVYKDFSGAINSIYLRILETSKIAEDVMADNEEETKISKKFDSNKSVGIAELKFKNSKGEEIRIIPPKAIDAKVSATSTLEPAQAYGVQNLFDSKYSIAWAEGNENTSGIGEKINIEFKSEVNITKIKIWNGFQRSETHFDANARVKKLNIAGNDYEMKDIQTPQEITLNKDFKGEKLTMEVKDIYKGSKYKDLVISEMMFYDGSSWFYPKTNIAAKLKSELLSNGNKGSLGKVLDKWLYNNYKDHIGDYNDTKSILLRSDYSFVIYEESSQDYSDGFTRQKIYDGNWSIVELGANKSKVKIFGKRRIINMGTGEYKGINESDQSLIFHDYLTITNNSINGERFFDELKF